jgi:hypothetical protein
MSELENHAKPHLKPLILGERVPLDRKAREIVATWAFLKSLMAQYTHPTQAPAPSAHYRWLYKERRPPRHGVYIWLAGYLGDRWGGFYRHVPLSTLKRPAGPDNRADHLNAYGVTFAVYKLVFQVFGATTERHGANLQHIGPLGMTTTRIWPNRGEGTVLVPQPLGFDDTGLEDFSMIFVREG